MAMKRRMVQVQITLDPKELAAFDKLLAKRPDTNRSLAIRQLIRREIDASHLSIDSVSRMNQPSEELAVPA